MRIWIEDKGTSWCGHEWVISSEWHDGIVYIANSKEEAVRKYEDDRDCKVDAVEEWQSKGVAR